MFACSVWDVILENYRLCSDSHRTIASAIFVKAQETEVGQGQSLSKLPQVTCGTHM